MSFRHFSRSAILAGAASLLLYGCSTVPVTGRKQINLISDTEIVKMTKAAFEQQKAQSKISTDPKMNDMLQNVGYRISQTVFWDMPLAEWEFVVFDSPGELNAFAMPGGKVGVYSGLFRIIGNEEDLAAVISHEIAHVTARHTHERLSQAGILKAGQTVSSIGTGGLSNLVYGSAIGSNMEAWDRAKEAEADRIGILYMARSGYDPRGAIRIMERMAQIDSGAPQGYGSTHPSSQERLDALHGYLPEAMEEYEKAQKKEEPF